MGENNYTSHILAKVCRSFFANNSKTKELQIFFGFGPIIYLLISYFTELYLRMTSTIAEHTITQYTTEEHFTTELHHLPQFTTRH